MVKIAFVGAGSTVFMRNIVGDCLLTPALSDAHFALMDIDARRLEESATVAKAMIAATSSGATLSTHTTRRKALEGADFVVTAFQVGGYLPCTITDFEIPKAHGLRQANGATLGVGGIMRGLRTVPVLCDVAADMQADCPGATPLQYVHPMAITTWASAEPFPALKPVGLCPSVHNTVEEQAHHHHLPHYTLHSPGA